jgi:flagellar protein FliJ
MRTTTQTIPLLDTMPRFKYRLTTLLKIREGVRDERRAELATAYLAEQKLRERRDAAQAELDEHLSEQQQSLSQGAAVDVDRLLSTHRYQLVLRAEITVLDRQAEMLAAEIEKRRQALVAADREVRALEKLKDSQFERHRQGELLAEHKQFDEIASRGHHREEGA